MAVYQWKRNNDMHIDAQTAGEHLAKLEQKHKFLTPEIVLDDSRPAGSVLHSCFEWNNTVAAEKYRLYQARHIIGNIVLVVAQPKNEPATPPQTVRAFLSISPLPKKGNFISLSSVISNPEYHAVALQNALCELAAFQKKYSFLEELTDVFNAIDQLNTRA